MELLVPIGRLMLAAVRNPVTAVLVFAALLLLGYLVHRFLPRKDDAVTAGRQPAIVPEQDRPAQP